MIIMAACRIVSAKTNKEVVIPVFRHGDIYRIIDSLGLKREDIKVIEEGFIDNKKNFFDRQSAFVRAKECGQLPGTLLWAKEDQDECELYSEDLY